MAGFHSPRQFGRMLDAPWLQLKHDGKVKLWPFQQQMIDRVLAATQEAKDMDPLKLSMTQYRIARMIFDGHSQRVITKTKELSQRSDTLSSRIKTLRQKGVIDRGADGVRCAIPMLIKLGTVQVTEDRQPYVLDAGLHLDELRGEWITDTVRRLAATEPSSRTPEYSRAPILADALQDAGCDIDEILAALRQPLLDWRLYQPGESVKAAGKRRDPASADAPAHWESIVQSVDVLKAARIFERIEVM